MVFESEERVEQVQKEKKCQSRVLKNELEHLKELNCTAVAI
jgi:hypothetical protein